jgi:hypothetical protein
VAQTSASDLGEAVSIRFVTPASISTVLHHEAKSLAGDPVDLEFMIVDRTGLQQVVRRDVQAMSPTDSQQASNGS